MTMDGVPGLVALVVVSLATLAIGTYGLRFSRTTSDFYVASRSVRPGLNASAIGGEYLSAASFLGVAALVLTAGAQMLWYPIGWTAGYLVLLVLVAAPLRRSGAYTLPDFAEARLGSRRVRALCSVLVVAIGWLYLLPQFQGAGLTLTAAVDAPKWVGAARRRRGRRGQRGQRRDAQHHLRPGLPVLAQAHRAAGPGRGAAGDLGRRRAARTPTGGGAGWSLPLGEGNQGLYTTYSIVLATFLGTMGLPHVVVRFYTNPDGAGRPPYHAGGAGPARRLLPAAADLRRPRPGVRRRRGRHRRARAASADARRARRRPAHRAGHRRRVRGVPVDLVRSGHRGLRRARAGRARRPARRASRRSGSGPRSRSACRSRPRCSPPTCRSPGRSGWPSRSPRRRSVRCWCSASGGAG